MSNDPTPFPGSAVDRADPIPVVLFDGDCPLCAREIAHYRRLDSSGRLVWIDISREPDLERHYGICPADAMSRFHVRDRRGRWLTGAWAFAELWAQLPGYRVASAALRRLKLLPLLDRAYGPFARWRLARRCADGACAALPRHPPELQPTREGDLR